MKLSEIMNSKIFLESKKKVWQRKDGKLVNKSSEESPSKNAIFNDKFIKTKIRIRDGK